MHKILILRKKRWKGRFLMWSLCHVDVIVITVYNLCREIILHSSYNELVFHISPFYSSTFLLILPFIKLQILEEFSFHQYYSLTLSKPKEACISTYNHPSRFHKTIITIIIYSNVNSGYRISTTNSIENFWRIYLSFVFVISAHIDYISIQEWKFK